MTTKEEIFRLKSGRPAATFTVKNYSSLGEIKLVGLRQIIVNKEELQELINWLISKLDEM